MNQKKNTPAQAVVIPGLQQCLAQLRAGNVDAFEAAARDLAARHPNASKPLQLVGVAALMRGNLQEAVDKLQAAARLNQNDASIWDNLGVALQRAGHLQAAIECFQGSVRLDPNVAGVWVNAAATYGELGDHVLARNTAARAVKLDPNLVEAHLNLGNALRELGDTEPAVAELLRALELDPNCAPAHMGLARAMQLQRGGRPLALKHARRAMEIAPDYLDGQLVYAMLCSQVTLVVDALRKICAAKPYDLVAAQSLLWASLADHRLSREEMFSLHVDFGRRFEPMFAALRREHVNDKTPGRKLKVGFLSGDLRRHPVADHLIPLWTGLDRRKVAIHAYYTHSRNVSDEATEQLKGLADHWVDAADIADDALAQRIREDGIDILIDLAGHTDHNRCAVLMRKPAPVQMHWIGQPSTTGLSVIDYYIADPLFAPPGMDALCTEKLIRLPTYNNQQGMPSAPEVGPLPALANGFVTFASTARADKINVKVIGLWAQVLRAVPDSRMMFADAGVAEVQARIADVFRAAGVDTARLEFRDCPSEQSYMALHNEIDIVLDTFPFNGGTTVTHGLYMGVPTITLAGSVMPQRMALARLSVVGLDDWVAMDEQAYVALAVSKAADVEGLAALRGALRKRLEEAPLRGIKAFGTSFEAGLRLAWKRWCAGELPASIDVSAPKAGRVQRAINNG